MGFLLTIPAAIIIFILGLVSLIFLVVNIKILGCFFKLVLGVVCFAAVVYFLVLLIGAVTGTIFLIL